MKSFQIHGTSGMSLWSPGCQFLVLCWLCPWYHHSSRLSFTLPSHSNLVFRLSLHPVISSFELSFSACPPLLSHYHHANLDLSLLQGCSGDFLILVSTYLSSILGIYTGPVFLKPYFPSITSCSITWIFSPSYHFADMFLLSSNQGSDSQGTTWTSHL